MPCDESSLSKRIRDQSIALIMDHVHSKPRIASCHVSSLHYPLWHVNATAIHASENPLYAAPFALVAFYGISSSLLDPRVQWWKITSSSIGAHFKRLRMALFAAGFWDTYSHGIQRTGQNEQCINHAHPCLT